MEAGTLIVGIAIGIVAGTIVGYAGFRLALRGEYEKTRREAEEHARKAVEEEKRKVEALLSEKREELFKKEKELSEKEINLRTLSEKLHNEGEQLSKVRSELESKEREIIAIKEETNSLRNQYLARLKEVSGLSEEEAIKRLLEELKEKAIVWHERHLHEIIQEYKEKEQDIARKIVIEAIQRIGAETAAQNSVIYVELKDDSEKGKLIGREGRNINAFESLTGVDLIIDDTPCMVGLSCFDPEKREIARIALEMLLADGRIHPATIEQAVQKATSMLEEEITKIGRKAISELGIGRMHPELVKLVGRMHLRTSYAQNLLKHSIEVAKLCGTVAAEIGLNPVVAKRAGLLHDIGKVWPEGADRPHAIVGMELAQKYGESFEVCNAIGSHHNDIEMKVLYAPLVQACDAISGARPGARREIKDLYLHRVEEMEKIALSFASRGVEKAYVIQGGRELRVIVSVDQTSDADVDVLADEIARKIEENLKYPGQIKVTVIREYKKVAYAK